MRNSNWKLKLGIILILFSGVIFALLFVIPFLNIDNKIKITLSTIDIILMEASFWLGGLLVGKELFTKYKFYLNPLNWFKKKTKEIIVADQDEVISESIKE